MSRDGNGNFSLVSGNPVSGGTTIDPAWANNTLNDVAAGLTTSVASDGQTTMTGNLKLNGNTITNLAAAAARSSPPNAGQVQDSALTLLSSVSGTDTITASVAPAITSYTAGQNFQFVSAGANATTTVTININSLGAKSILRPGGGAMAVGDIASGQIVELYYNGTNFEFVNTQHAKTADTATTATTASAAPWSGLTSVPTNISSVAGTDSIEKISLSTTQATTSGTSIDFTSIPSWAKRITVMLSGVNTSGSSAVTVQIGSGSVSTTGYSGSAGYTGSSSAAGLMSGGFQIETTAGATVIRHGHVVLTHIGSNLWVCSTVSGRSDSAYMQLGGGSKTLSGVLDRIRLTTASGSDTFVAGSVNILVEGY